MLAARHAWLWALFLAFFASACAANNGRRDAGPGDSAVECTNDSDCVDDGVFCNGPTVCREGACVPGTPPSCNDGVTCTVDTCLVTSDECQNTPDNSLCPSGSVCTMDGCVVASACEFDSDCSSDGIFCNGMEVCIDATCRSPEMHPCNDGDSCTIDECVESSASCENELADHLTDPLHCGPTGANDCVPCPGPTAAQANMRAVCNDGACGLGCQEGFNDADGDLSNGCECEGGAAADEPDTSYLDTNCDGIDGDRARGILVSGSMGNDTATCGLAFGTPCRTLAHAITRAISESRRDLFVMAGTYDEVVILRDGIRIFGGYDTSWVRGPRSSSAHRTEIRGALDATEGQFLTVRAHGLVVAPTLENLVLTGPDATTAGASSYVVHARDTAGLNVIRCTLQQGHGADGATGAAGVDAPVVVATSGMGGATGGAAATYFGACDNSTAGAGGMAGTNSSCAGTAGGAGGGGGPMDTSCILVYCERSECWAQPGRTGAPAAQFADGSYGAPGAGGAGRTTCGPGTPGNPGRVQNGAAGAGATGARGSVVGGYWVGQAGGTGSTGMNGGGGGGGGGSGGCDNGLVPGDNTHGAGGGGGGAGGCAAVSGGGGGGGGGGSFGVFAVSSTVRVEDCELQRGNGGRGGAGGSGGRGQSGGPAGTAGMAAGTAAAGGAGGAGGHGGHGGGGGGGAGGLAFGIFSLSSTVDTVGLTVAGGSAGSAGPGGVSAPTAPSAEDDGNDGAPGVAGLAGEIFTCAAASGC